MNTAPTPFPNIDQLIKAKIAVIAATISEQQLGLVHHRPEASAQPARCFENVDRKVAQDGGRIQFGWTFHHRYVERIPGPGYLFVTHHAVWHAPDGQLIDVGQYPDRKHHPLAPGGSILFLVDDKARPVRTENLVAPLPLRFFALAEDRELAAYVAKLNDDEQEECGKIYAGAEEEEEEESGGNVR
ncbi:MAG: hypothetical protein P4L80_02870 [Xanthobacteraceae bacterium]|nr:hypothetical protein [Xanthobacteraceae bacterium]